ncbi:DNA recombination protein RmuC [Phytobacter massiliensis]|uniref:DNA recombination protein RmuC n=1 Tax=Phytobacter massiliensis TaxID=1485952 RepID=UPI0002DB489A|nr:DNA recombination protein RmuC [Phytobacter massiliensis]
MMLTFAIAVFAAVLGGIVGWFITQQRFTQRLAALSDDKHQLDIDVSALRQNLRGLSERIDEYKARLAKTETLLEEERRLTSELDHDYTELKTTLTQREESFREQFANLEESKKTLAQQFENIANKIFEEKGKTFTATSKHSLDDMLKPFREQIEGFQKRVNEVHDASIRGNAWLNAEIKKVLDIGLQMSAEANNLTTALKGDSQQRGAWGEAQLRRTLEMSGLVEDTHYEVQSAFRDEEGRRKQTDYLIRLPDNKHIIIDSKVSLNAYDRACSAQTPDEQQRAMDDHIMSVRRHIDDLASKDYTSLAGIRSPSFVLMFMPIEAAYIEALKTSKGLFEYGYRKGIVLVSHTTLIPILRTVSNLWMIERSNSEAREISERAGEIFNNVCLVADRLSKLGGTLTTASNQYNDTVTSLVGKQGLYGKVERFGKLSEKVNRELPKLELSHRDFEHERVALYAEPLTEPADAENVIALADVQEGKV